MISYHIVLELRLATQVRHALLRSDLQGNLFPLSVLWAEVYVITKNSAGYFGSMRITLVSQLLTCIVIIGFMENQSVELNSIQT